MKGQSKQDTGFERTLFPEGTYAMTLKKGMVMMGKPTQYQPEGAPKIMFVWEYDDGEGNKFELVDFLGFPKNIAYNEKSKFWKRVGEIAGIALTNENADLLDLNLGEFIQTYDELLEHISAVDSQGKSEKAEVKALIVGEQELLGKKCQLVVGVWRSDKGEGNEVVKVMQLGGGAAGPKRPSKAPATAQAAPAQSAPPARPARPAPAPAAQKPPTEALYDNDGNELPY